ncbi:MAG: carboxylating nicotinate-nucleotide diphosphorylase [Bauldia sp.]|nr:carboxylating nicotinate-nucleotide diphosphorylase [Bauldia sp.]
MTSVPLPDLPRHLVRAAVEAALAEDLGRAGDITSAAIIPPDETARAVIAARRPGVVAGLPLALEAFRQMDSSIAVEVLKPDGSAVAAGDVIARIEGRARPMLGAERVALNFLGHLSGVATATAALVARVSHTKARVTCTRKTTPGLRTFEKYAVRCGGGSSHRYGLDDAILIKDNHIAVAGGIEPAIERARAFAGHLVKIEIEVDTIEQLWEAFNAHADVILLDNMTPTLLRQAVQIVAGQAILEASGNVTLETIAAIAETGVDYISSGWITHSAPTLDLGLDVE